MRKRLLLLLMTFAIGGISPLPVPAHGRDHRVQRREAWLPEARVPQVILLPQIRTSDRPPGWDRGRKTGWGACDVPPGLAKKSGCGWTFFGNERRRPHRGPVIVISIP